MRPLRAIVLLTLAACWSEVELSNPVLLTREEQRESAVGHSVTLQGIVSHAKIPTLVGVEIDAGDLRGMPAVATGWLRKHVVTQEDLDREEKQRGGVFAHRGPGTFYFLADADGRLARAAPAP